MIENLFDMSRVGNRYEFHTFKIMMTMQNNFDLKF